MRKKNMINKLLIVGVIVAMAAFGAGCSKGNVVHCDRCGKECKTGANSNMDESWIVYCDDCAKETGIDQMVTPGYEE